MRRFLLVLIVAAVAAFAISYSLRKTGHASSAAVTSLLPRDTLVFAYLPDFNRTRVQWRQSDLYEIWREPEVQEFLQKPRANLPATAGLGQKMQELETLRMRDAFLAITSVENQAVELAAGFRFSGSAEDAEKIIGSWRARSFAKTPNAKHETIVYTKHKIEITTEGLFTLATAYVDDRFLAANNIELLKATIDRADGSAKDRGATLTADEVFTAASKRMPENFAAMVFARVDQCVEKLLPALNSSSLKSDSLPMLRQIRSFCGATGFDGGKIRDTIFVGMPPTAASDLSRATLALGSKDTFFYFATLLNLASAAPPAGTGPWQNIPALMTKNGVTLEDWNAAFGTEFSALGDWPAETRWPGVVATLPIKDPAKARQILNTIAVSKEDESWREEEKDGVHFFRMQSSGGLFSLAPTIALTDKLLIAGGDSGSVESALKRNAAGGAGLAAVAGFQSAEREVGAAKQTFGYVDLALLYTRLDAALRPILIMGAAFMPSVSDTIELGKLPAAETITKHLSPLVISQRPVDDGFITESVGSITAYQGIALGGIVGTAAATLYQHQISGGANAWSNLIPGLSVPALQRAPASPAPSPTPDETP